MNRFNVKIAGLALLCFSLGVIVQIFIPNVFIVMLLAFLLLAVGIFVVLKC